MPPAVVKRKRGVKSLRKVRLHVLLTLAFAIFGCHRLSPSDPPPSPDNQKDEHRGDDQSEDKGPQNDQSPTPEPSPSPLPTNLDEPMRAETQSIQEHIVNKTCLGCHSASNSSNRYVDLTDLQNQVTTDRSQLTPGISRKTVLAGCPDVSMFYLSMKDGSMPKNSTNHVSAADLAIVRTWIEQFVPDSNNRHCDDEPPDDDLVGNN